jgi:hypothetical protein
MNARTKARRRPTAKSCDPAPTTTGQGHAVQLPKRQLERSVAWTVPERLRLLWYQLRMEAQEYSYLSKRVVESQLRLPVDWASLGRDPRAGGRTEGSKRRAGASDRAEAS